MKRRIISIVLAALICLCLPVTASAVTVPEAVSWTQSQIGEMIGNGQCTRLVEKYAMEFWEFKLTTTPKDYLSAEVPEGWEKILYSDGFIPLPGDIAVWAPGSGPWGWISETGHTAIVVSATEKSLTSVDQNWGSDGNGSPAKLVEHSYISFYGVLRPPFGEKSVSPSEPPGISGEAEDADITDINDSTDVPLTAFADIPSEWAEASIRSAVEANLIPASMQSQYAQAATRAEFCALAVAIYESLSGEISGRVKFTDTEDENVEKAAAIGVTVGTGENRFSPGLRLSREQAAVMLSRLAAALGKQLPPGVADFTDNAEISGWAIDEVGQIQVNGVMMGVGGNRFAPKGACTREQSITTIMRLLSVI